jgi:hypothetical protein
MHKSRKELPDAAALDRLHRQLKRNWKEEFKYDAVRTRAPPPPLPGRALPAPPRHLGWRSASGRPVGKPGRPAS